MKMPQLVHEDDDKINTNCSNWGGAGDIHLAAYVCKSPHLQKTFQYWTNGQCRGTPLELGGGANPCDFVWCTASGLSNRANTRS